MQTNARVLRCATDGLGEDDDIVGDGLDMIDNIFDQVVENSVPTDEEPLKSIVFPSIVHGLAHACNDNLKIASGSCQVQVRLLYSFCFLPPSCSLSLSLSLSISLSLYLVLQFSLFLPHCKHCVSSNLITRHLKI